MADVTTLAAFREMLTRGTRLCSECLPQDNGYIEKKQHWIICLARLPRSLQIIQPSQLPLVITQQMLRDGPEHFKVWVPDEPEARNYFENIPPGDPGVYHTTREMIFVRLDIAKFTQFPENIQPRVLAELHELVHGVLQKRMFAMEPSKAPERVLHTGDGFILAFAMPTGDVRPWPLQLAQNMAKALDQRNDKSIPIRFRIAVTTGPVYVTGDLSGIPNYIGSSISESERLLQCIPSNQDDVVCFSEAIYRKYRGGLSAMKFFRMGSVSDKHQTMHRLYLLEYTD